MKKYLIAAAVIILVIAAALILPGNPKKTVPAKPKQGLYLAMGDSVAAGIGLDDYSDSSACDRTKESYPAVLAAKLNYNLTSVACSGARTQAGLLGSQTVNELALPPQINSLSATKKPNLITITIGANDANWTTYIGKCYSGACGSAADNAAVASDVATAAGNLATVLTQIKNTYPSAPPRVVVTGYYKLFAASPVANCVELTGLEPDELVSIRQLQDGVDSALQTTTARFNFATFVPIDFTGHELCSADPWVQGLGSKEPYHPTAAGQTAIAQQILTVFKGQRP